MANTLKFGNGNWATKDGSTLAYNDESGFNPLPFDFTRASSATVVNKNGLIEEVASGIPRIDFLGNTKGALLLEPSRTNLIAQSEAFGSSYWLKSGASIQGDPSTAGVEKVVNGNFANGLNNWTVNGGSYATIVSGALNSNNTDAGNWFAENVSQDISFVNGKMYKVTFKAKNISGNLNLRLTQGANVIFNGDITSSFVDYEVFYTANADNSSVRIFCNDNVGQFQIDNVSVKEVQGFASPSADSPLGAFKLVEDTSNGGHNIQRVENVSNATIYTSSVFVKYGGREWIRLTDAQSSNRIHFNTLTGAFGAITGTVIDYNSIALSNGWYKLSITTTSVATAYALRVSLAEADNDVSYTGDGTSGVYIYGAQLEAGSYSTSLINTSGSAVTREADVCNNGANSEVINSTEGVFYVQMAKSDVTAPEGGIRLSLDASNYIALNFATNNRLNLFVNVGGSNQVYMDNSTYNLSEYHKIAVKYKLNNYAVYVDGTQIHTDTSATVPTGLNKMNYIGFQGNTKDIKLYTTALTDAELIALTTI